MRTINKETTKGGPMSAKVYLRSTRNLYKKHENGLVVFYSYITPVAFIKDGQLTISENVWSITTAKHLNWIEDYVGVQRKFLRIPHKDFKSSFEKAKGHEDKPAPDMLKTVGMVSAMFGVLSENDKEAKVKYQKRFYEKVPGIQFPEDWDQLSTEEKEKRLNNVNSVALEKREG